MNRPLHYHNASESNGPFAGPPASIPYGTPPLEKGQSHPIRSGNSGAPQGTTAPARSSTDARLSAAAIDVINSRLSDRDRAILGSVDEHQFLTARHIEALHFHSIAPEARSRITRRVLARLRGLRVLDTLDRRIGGERAGSQGLIYHVGVAGDRLAVHRTRGSGRLRYEPSARFVAHRLAVADAHIALIEADREARISLADSAVEPAAWRTFTGIGAARRTLKPDLYAETATTGDLVRAWFIEVDLGTEHIPTLLTKCLEYESYRQTGIEQDRHGSFPVVVWSLWHPDAATAQRRRHALSEAISANRKLPNALFRIVSPSDLLPLIQHGGAQ